MCLAAMESIHELDLFHSAPCPNMETGGRVFASEDCMIRCRNHLLRRLPQESLTKETDAALLSVVGFPGFSAGGMARAETLRVLFMKLQGVYGMARFVRDGHQTVIEDHTRLHYELWELKQFENIECEWPLFFCYRYIDALMLNDRSLAQLFRDRITNQCVVDVDGFQLIPELFRVPLNQIEDERLIPHSAIREPNENLPLVWAQSLFLTAELIYDGCIDSSELDPLGRAAKTKNSQNKFCSTEYINNNNSNISDEDSIAQHNHLIGETVEQKFRVGSLTDDGSLKRLEKILLCSNPKRFLNELVDDIKLASNPRDSLSPIEIANLIPLDVRRIAEEIITNTANAPPSRTPVELLVICEDDSLKSSILNRFPSAPLYTPDECTADGLILRPSSDLNVLLQGSGECKSLRLSGRPNKYLGSMSCAFLYSLPQSISSNSISSPSGNSGGVVVSFVMEEMTSPRRVSNLLALDPLIWVENVRLILDRVSKQWTHTDENPKMCILVSKDLWMSDDVKNLLEWMLKNVVVNTALNSDSPLPSMPGNRRSSALLPQHPQSVDANGSSSSAVSLSTSCSVVDLNTFKCSSHVRTLGFLRKKIIGALGLPFKNTPALDNSLGVCANLVDAYTVRNHMIWLLSCLKNAGDDLSKEFDVPFNVAQGLNILKPKTLSELLRDALFAASHHHCNEWSVVRKCAAFLKFPVAGLSRSVANLKDLGIKILVGRGFSKEKVLKPYTLSTTSHNSLVEDESSRLRYIIEELLDDGDHGVCAIESREELLLEVLLTQELIVHVASLQRLVTVPAVEGGSVFDNPSPSVSVDSKPSSFWDADDQSDALFGKDFLLNVSRLRAPLLLRILSQSSLTQDALASSLHRDKLQAATDQSSPSHKKMFSQIPGMRQQAKQITNRSFSHFSMKSLDDFTASCRKRSMASMNGLLLDLGDVESVLRLKPSLIREVLGRLLSIDRKSSFMYLGLSELFNSNLDRDLSENEATKSLLMSRVVRFHHRWREVRELHGALGRQPEDFFEKVFYLCTSGMVSLQIGHSSVLDFHSVNCTTPHEPQFRLMLLKWLDTIGDPAYRQLVIEMLLYLSAPFINSHSTGACLKINNKSSEEVLHELKLDSVSSQTLAINSKNHLGKHEKLIEDNTKAEIDGSPVSPASPLLSPSVRIPVSFGPWADPWENPCVLHVDDIMAKVQIFIVKDWSDYQGDVSSAEAWQLFFESHPGDFTVALDVLKVSEMFRTAQMDNTSSPKC